MGNSISTQKKNKVQITFDKFHSNSPLNYLESKKYLENEKVVFSRSTLLGLLFKTIDYTKIRFPFVSKSISVFFRVYQGESMPDLKKVKIIRGYFQDLKNFENEMDQIFEEVSKILNSIFMERNLGLKFPELNGKYQVIHLRLGDYKDERFGVIKNFSKTQYFDAALPIIVCSDGEISEISQRIGFKPKTIFTPFNSDGWEALAIMARAEVVIASNSSLAWWGAAVACHNGGKAYFPNQWRKHNNPSNPYSRSIPNAFEYQADFE